MTASAAFLTGASVRSAIDTNYPALVDLLASKAEENSKLHLLRLNWYDSGNKLGGMPDATQTLLGLLPRVKLRLGRRGYLGQQKGVDLLLGLDLVSHAQNRGLDVMYLLSGDGDLTEAVEAAQAHGVRVTLIAVAEDMGSPPQGVSKHLQMEADGLLPITVKELRSCMQPRRKQATKPMPPPMLPVSLTVEEIHRRAAAVARTAFELWLPFATDGQLALLERRQIPIDVYRAMLLDLSRALDRAELDDEVRGIIRSTFWEQVDASSAAPTEANAE